MNFSAVEAFLAIVRSNGVSKAAEVLCLTQPTVSKRLSLLEAELGVVLIERGRGIRDVRLTDAGEAFLDVAERWMTLHRETLAISSHAERSSLRIGSVAAINFELLDDVYERLSQLDLPLLISIQSGRSRELFDKVARSELDVAFTRQTFAHDQVITRKLYSQPVVGLCLPASPLAGRRDVDAGELRGEHEIFASSDEEFLAWHATRWTSRVQGRLTVDTIHLTLSLLRSPEQWSLVPARVAQVACLRRGFSSFSLWGPTPQRSCFMITHARKRRAATEAMRALNTLIDRALSNDPQ
ncbi:LysR family transcriptional regulator [Paraburkholderia sp. Ac-20340]|uniref:LysR substrate-binding domain-containing protein n=1 Tax=Paraburkholderia sp. Ac-20340 TaxID=2703888 RepID=UPI00197F2A74|nr:LysR family transcriptional regulator [Paraburkholderia sp. Ac-20340]